jgi:hypothetical protein
MLKEKRSRIPRVVALAADIVVGVFLGGFIAIAWLVAKPAVLLDAPPPPAAAGTSVDRHRVDYIHGRVAPVRNSEWVAKERAFITSTPGSLQLLEQDVNRWMTANFGEADRSVKWAGLNVEVHPELPSFRFDGSETQIGLPIRFVFMGAERRVVLQTRGGFVVRGQSQVFQPRTVYVGSCPIPVALGGESIYKKFADGFVVTDEVRKAWGAIEDIRVEESRMKVAIR